MTAPDVAALPGGTAPVVVRLQRREFWFHAPPERGAPVTFDLAGGAIRCAKTDKDGYAAMTVGVPYRPGRYRVLLRCQDDFGDTASGQAEFFVLHPDRPILAVDLDDLPSGGAEARAAAAALERLGKQAQIVYLTERRAGNPTGAREFLASQGYPEAAVLPWDIPGWWRRRLWWKRQDGGGAVASLRARLPNLTWGLTTGKTSAQAFSAGGLKPLVVGKARTGIAGAEYFPHWPDLTLTPSRPPATAPAAP